MVMELSVNLTVDCSGLEAGVGGAKRYRGCHHSKAVRDELRPAAECLDIFRDPQRQWLEAILQSG